jgi:hypothetical protein
LARAGDGLAAARRCSDARVLVVDEVVVVRVVVAVGEIDSGASSSDPLAAAPLADGDANRHAYGLRMGTRLRSGEPQLVTGRN